MVKKIAEASALYLSAPSRYLLDTNICIYIAKHNPASVRARFAQHNANELVLSVITYGELCFGIAKSQAPAKAKSSIEQLTQAIEISALPASASEHYGAIRAALEKKGQVIGNNDLWIAAHARANGWVLVTNNEKEFKRVPNLRVENWVKP